MVRLRLRYPCLLVEAFFLEFLSLRYRIEDSEIRGCIITASRDPLPIEGVAGIVGIHQRVPKPFFAEPPVDQQILRQQAAHNHPHSIVHASGFPKLAHTGVYQRDPGDAALPRIELC